MSKLNRKVIIILSLEKHYWMKRGKHKKNKNNKEQRIEEMWDKNDYLITENIERMNPTYSS